jgi:hypothetical protein
MGVCRWRALAALLVLALAKPIAFAQQQQQKNNATCPGIVRSVCTAECQLHLCRALVDFYAATQPWSRTRGWAEAMVDGCEAAVAAEAAPSAPAPYCRWHGVTCCNATQPGTLAHYDAPPCPVRNAVVALQLEANNVGGVLASQAVLEPLLRVGRCGLLSLVLQSNALCGKQRSYRVVA